MIRTGDIVLFTEEKRDLHELPNRWEMLFEGHGLRINIDKTDYMIFGDDMAGEQEHLRGGKWTIT